MRGMAHTVRITAFCAFNDTVSVSLTRVRHGHATELRPDFVSVSELIRSQFASGPRALHIPRRVV